jgi:4-hydroxy-2-oxoheptanedioate aldolase
MTEIFQLEQKLEACLIRLNEEFGLCAVKAEFEAEGASFRDLARLRRLTARHNVLLYLKIGGVEALRDIKDALDLGVDGLVAPMVESPFGVVKFVQAVESVFSRREVIKSINIETRNAVDCVDDILSEARGRVDNVTIGRTDLTHSYLDSEFQPDSDFIFDLIEKLSHKVKACGLTLTVGGSITKDSIERFKKYRESWGGRLCNIETRKIVLPTDQLLEKENALAEALEFEELYLSSKLETERWLSQADRDRLAKLKKRI